jgi:hypothetical protein
VEGFLLANYEFVTIKGEESEHQALFVAWPEVSTLLGRRFAHDEKDERDLIEALDAIGAPAVQYAELEYGTETDARGFYILGPVLPQEYRVNV